MKKLLTVLVMVQLLLIVNGCQSNNLTKDERQLLVPPFLATETTTK